jgi:hypothetical protein
VQSAQDQSSAQGSPAGHSSAYQAQSSQEPTAGPAYEPTAHPLVSPHQPQLPVAVQSSQDAGEAHGSPGQSTLSHFQSPHEPTPGPASVPDMHAAVDSHQPQPAPTVHSPQVPLPAHGSGAAQALPSHFQSAHVPPAGPALDPVEQAPAEAHQPQSADAVQASHEPSGAHGSVVPSHAARYQTQSAQDPPAGPPPEPVRQAASLRHHPQLGREVQESQTGESAQGSAAVLTHEPSVQASPAQQSRPAAQAPEPTWQAHRPAAHVIQPQQSALERHVPLASTQHVRATGLSRQLSPVQHSPPTLQAAPAGSHDAVGRAHVPERHSRPVTQRAPLSQHGCPSPPQGGVSQALPRHSPAQRLPHLPQWRASLAVSTQPRSQQVSPAPVQLVPPQQACPSSPQAAGTVSHVPPVQTRPSLQAVPPQHGCRAPPQGGGVWQTPPEQTSPDAQAPPEQHGCRAPPHAAGGAQVLRSQTRPARHMAPVQHGWRSPPQAASRVHRPAVQTRSVTQAMPEQQTWPSRPQASTPVHVPAEQTRPPAHADPLQQGSRSWPHGTRPSGAPSRPSSRGTSPPESPPLPQDAGSARKATSDAARRTTWWSRARCMGTSPTRPMIQPTGRTGYHRSGGRLVRTCAPALRGANFVVSWGGTGAARCEEEPWRCGGRS